MSNNLCCHFVGCLNHPVIFTNKQDCLEVCPFPCIVMKSSLPQYGFIYLFSILPIFRCSSLPHLLMNGKCVFYEC